ISSCIGEALLIQAGEDERELARRKLRPGSKPHPISSEIDMQAKLKSKTKAKATPKAKSKAKTKQQSKQAQLGIGERIE
ncbi:MAG: hypothetical protein EZS28_050331, partial [Streblomastix strix]